MVNAPLEAVTVTLAVDVADPVEFVAVSVYVVVEVGLTLVDPLADVDVKLPGVMAMLAAPVVTQFRVLLDPDVMPVGLAAKDVIAGAEPLLVLLGDVLDEPPQFNSPAQATRMITITHRSSGW
jgi:hypothetical protein